MAKRFLVLTEFKAVDGMTPGMAKMNQGFSRFAMRITDSNDIIGKSFSGMNKAINTGLIAATAALAMGVGVAATQFVELDNRVTSAGAKFDDINSKAANFRDQLKPLSAAAREVGRTTEFSAIDAAGALDAMSAAGFKSSEAMSVLKGTTDFATASGEDLSSSVGMLADVLGSFNLKATAKTPEELAKNMQRVSDVMAQTANASTIGLKDIYDSVAAGGSSFQSAGQSIETYSALVGILGNAAIKGSDAGTGLKVAILRLAKPAADAQKVMDYLGIKTKDANGNFLDIVDVIGQFSEATKDMGSQQKSAVLATVFGTHAINAMNVLMTAGTDKINAFRDGLLGSTGAANKMAEAMRGSLGNQLKRLQNAAMELGFKFLDAFAGEGRTAIADFTKALQNMDVQPIIDFARIALNILIFLGEHWKVLLSIAVSIKAVSIAMGILTVVTQLFGITLAATPIGWIIAGIAALAFGIVMLVTHFDTVKAAAKAAGQFLYEYFAKPIMTIGQIILKYLLTPINLFIDGILFILNLAAKIPGVGDKFASMASAIQATKDNINTTLTGSAGTFDYGGTIKTGMNRSNPFASAATPTPTSGPKGGMPGQYDVYLHNTPPGTTGKETKPAAGVKVQFAPALQ